MCQSALFDNVAEYRLATKFDWGCAMGLASGVHHLAISTADMKSQLTFFTDVLGAELKALYWMHNVPNLVSGRERCGYLICNR